jgi:hypothetical protein
MKRSGILLATAALATALVASEPAAAYYHRGWHGAHWGHGWHGGRYGWHGGWRGAHGRYGWRGRWGGNRWAWNGGWGWNRGWGWGGGWPAYAGGGYPNYGYGYGYPYGYGLAAAATAPVAVAAAATAPLVTGRSVATGPVEMGNYCTTPAKTCLLYNESWVGNGCSCRIPGGHARGSVTQ